MGILEDVRTRLSDVCRRHGVADSTPVAVRPLTPGEAIGERASDEFVITRGREVVIEAAALGARGQAFTDHPGRFVGTLGDVLALDLAQVGNRAVFVAVLNAALRGLGLAEGTVHCRNEDPRRCGPEMAHQLGQRFGRRRYGLVGLQPAILAGLAGEFGAERVRVVDLNPENIGSTRSGVEVWDGDVRLADLVEWCEVVLATGSSVVNGSIDDLVRLAGDRGRPLVFFGNTISGVAALAGMDRICPFAQ